MGMGMRHSREELVVRLRGRVREVLGGDEVREGGALPDLLHVLEHVHEELGVELLAEEVGIDRGRR